MNSLIHSSGPTVTPSPTDLATLLGMLLQFGHPSLAHIQAGWHCSVEFFCHGKGVEFKIRSDYGHPTPESAVQTCLDRMHTSLKQLGVQTP